MTMRLLPLILLAAMLPAVRPAHAQPAPPGPMQPGTYLLSLETGAVTPIAGADALVAWAPDSVTLAVAASAFAPQGLRIVNTATGADVTVVPPGVGATTTLAWSPDGAQLAYSLGGAQGGLYVVPAGGGEPQRLASDTVRAIAWMPDSAALSVITFDAQPAAWVWRIVTLDAASGATLATVLESSTPLSGGSPQPAPDSLCPWQLTWSPDGAYLAFSTGGIQNDPCANEATRGLWVWQASTGTRQQLAAGGVYGSGLGAGTPQWAEGSVFAQVESAATLYPPDGSTPTVLEAHTSTSLAAPPAQFAGGVLVWSGIGESSNNCGFAVVLSLRQGAPAARQLTGPMEYALSPALAPDGATVAWVDIAGQQTNLVIAATDGTTKRTLLTNVPWIDLPIGATWSPDGRSLLFSVSAWPGSVPYAPPPC